MKWLPSLCWTAPKTINVNRHFQVKSYVGKNKDRWVNIFSTINKKRYYKDSKGKTKIRINYCMVKAHKR